MAVNLPFSIFNLEKTQIGFPLVANHLSTGETSDWNNHVEQRTPVKKEKETHVIDCLIAYKQNIFWNPLK